MTTSTTQQTPTDTGYRYLTVNAKLKRLGLVRNYNRSVLKDWEAEVAELERKLEDKKLRNALLRGEIIRYEKSTNDI
jgi:hypothetical protein